MNINNYFYRVSDNNHHNSKTYDSLLEAKQDWNDNYSRIHFQVINRNTNVIERNFTTNTAVDEFCRQHGVLVEEQEWSLLQLEKGIAESNLPDSNLKTIAAQGKPRLSDVPPVSLFALGAAMSDGAGKYGRFNWRNTGTTASVFYDAMIRHLTDWYNGEDYAEDSKVSHLGHIMASCAILLDSTAHGILNDDRDKSKPDSVSRNPQHWKTT